MAGRKQKKGDWQVERLNHELGLPHNSDFHHSLYDLINVCERFSPQLQERAEGLLAEKWGVQFKKKGLIRFLESMIELTYNLGGETEAKFIYEKLPPMVVNSYKKATEGKSLSGNELLMSELVNRAYVSVAIAGKYDPTQDEQTKLGYLKTAANSSVNDYLKQSYLRHENSTDTIDDYFLSDAELFAEKVIDTDGPSTYPTDAEESADEKPVSLNEARPTHRALSAPASLAQFTQQFLSQLEEVDKVVEVLTTEFRKTFKELTGGSPEPHLIKGFLKDAASNIRRSNKFNPSLPDLEKEAFLVSLAKTNVREYVKAVRGRTAVSRFKKPRKAG